MPPIAVAADDVGGTWRDNTYPKLSLGEARAKAHLARST